MDYFKTASQWLRISSADAPQGGRSNRARWPLDSRISGRWLTQYASLILVGEKDNTGKVKQYNKAWSRRTGIKIIWIPNAAHNSNVDNPEFVNGCIKEFLENLN